MHFSAGFYFVNWQNPGMALGSCDSGLGMRPYSWEPKGGLLLQVGWLQCRRYTGIPMRLSHWLRAKVLAQGQAGDSPISPGIGVGPRVTPAWSIPHLLVPLLCLCIKMANKVALVWIHSKGLPLYSNLGVNVGHFWFQWNSMELQGNKNILQYGDVTSSYTAINDITVSCNAIWGALCSHVHSIPWCEPEKTTLCSLFKKGESLGCMRSFHMIVLFLLKEWQNTNVL